MDHSNRSKKDRLRSAAIVKMKYKLMVGGDIDPGFITVYKGVLSDLAITEEEVDDYIANNQEALQKTRLTEN